MPLLGFQKQFVEAVESGTKRQTIRAHRKRPFKVGDTLYLYYGLRTQQCRKLGEVECREVVPFKIEFGYFWMFYSRGAVQRRWLRLQVHDAADLARADGFESAADMAAWFEKTHGLPFDGQLIRW